MIFPITFFYIQYRTQQITFVKVAVGQYILGQNFHGHGNKYFRLHALADDKSQVFNRKFTDLRTIKPIHTAQYIRIVLGRNIPLPWLIEQLGKRFVIIFHLVLLAIKHQVTRKSKAKGTTWLKET